MPSNYNGVATALAALLPTAKTIASSTNTAPIVITTSAPHGCETGDSIEVFSHLVNTNANGQWEVVVTGATTLKLVGSTGNGVGGATGSIHNQGFGSDIQIPSVGDPRQIAGIAAAIEALADRTVLLEQQLGWNLVTHHGGSHTINNGGTLHLLDGSVVLGDVGCQLQGELELGDGTVMNEGTLLVTAHSNIQISGLGALHSDATSLVNLAGTTNIASGGDAHVTSGGVLDVDSGGLLDIKGDGNLAGDGDVIWRSGAKGEFKSGAELQVDVGATLDVNGAADFSAATSFTDAVVTLDAATTVADAATTTKTGPTVYSGDTGYRGLRTRLLVSADANQNIDPWKYDLIELTGAISATRNWTFSDPPNGERVEVLVICNVSELGSHSIQIKNSGGSNVVRFDGTSSGNNKWADIRWFAGPDIWDTTRHCAQDLGGVI
jgi:hypothetical protein